MSQQLQDQQKPSLFSLLRPLVGSLLEPSAAIQRNFSPDTQMRMRLNQDQKSELLTATSVNVGFIAFTSRIIFGLAVDSKDSSFRLKINFSFGFS